MGSYRESRSRTRSRSSKSRSRTRSVSRDHRRSRSGSYKRRRSPSPYERRRGGGGGSSSGNGGGGIPNRLNPEPSTTLGVFGLSMYTTERDLKDLFSKYGKVSQIRLIVDKRTNKSRGFAFVYYETIDDAKEAKRKCHGAEMDGKHIRVDYSIGERDYSQLPPSRPPPPFRYRRSYRSPSYDRRERGSPDYKRYSRSRSRSYERRYRRSTSYRR